MEDKINKSYLIIEEFLKNHKNPYISFSGGKDSTILLHLIRNIYPDIPAVFINTGLELPEIVKFVNTFDNIIWANPKHHFYYCVKKYGIPAISKKVAMNLYYKDKEKYREFLLNGQGKKWSFLLDSNFKLSDKCCYHLKKAPVKKIEKEYSFDGSFVGIRQAEGGRRKFIDNPIIKNKCYPLLYWTDDDIDSYIDMHNIKLADCYNKEPRQTRTGCMLCLMGCQFKEFKNKIEYLIKYHPKIWQWALNKLGYKEFLLELIRKNKLHKETIKFFKEGGIMELQKSGTEIVDDKLIYNIFDMFEMRIETEIEYDEMVKTQHIYLKDLETQKKYGIRDLIFYDYKNDEFDDTELTRPFSGFIRKQILNNDIKFNKRLKTTKLFSLNKFDKIFIMERKDKALIFVSYNDFSDFIPLVSLYIWKNELSLYIEELPDEPKLCSINYVDKKTTKKLIKEYYFD